MSNDPGICKDDACPVLSTTVGARHSIDTEGCSTGELLRTVLAQFTNLLQTVAQHSSLLQEQVPQDTNYRPTIVALKTAADRVLLLLQQLLPFLPALNPPALPDQQSARTVATRPAVTPTFEEYLRFWLDHGNSIFVASLSAVPHLEMIVAPQVSINARSTLGQFRFKVQDDTVQKL